MARNRTPLYTIASITAVALLGGALTGCTSIAANPQTGNYAAAIGNAPATSNDTPYSQALMCLGAYARTYNITPPRIAVGRINDLTGATSQVTGTQLTQGASLFAMTAVGRAGGRLVERYDTAVPEIELKYANSKLLSDAPERAGQDPSNYRKVFAGEIAGSQYYIVGGITELNSNIRSSGVGAYPGGSSTNSAKGVYTNQVYVTNVAMDLRLVDSQSQEVVDLVSYQKQIVGYQVSAGVFDFFHGTIIDLSGGKSAVEPSHLAVRTLVERAVFEFLAKAYGVTDTRGCLPPEADPLRT